jgi:PAS domain S-box-containing protein
MGFAHAGVCAMIQPKHTKVSNNTSAASVGCGAPGNLSPRVLELPFMFARVAAAGWSLSPTVTLESGLTDHRSARLGHGERQVTTGKPAIRRRRLAHTSVDPLAKASRGAVLRSLAQLHRFTTGLIEAGDLSAVLEQMLTAAMEVQGAAFGNVQLFDAELGGLVIVVQRNFKPPFLEHFSLVRGDDGICGRAARTRARVIIEDVQTDPEFTPHRHVAAVAGFRAVQSSPLLGRRGELLGMLSTHFRKPHRPAQYALRVTDIYVQQAARMVERQRSEEEHNKLAAIVQNCSDFIGIATLSGRAVFVNAAGRRMVGLRQNGPLPFEISSYVAVEEQQRLRQQILPVVERNGFWDGEMSLRQFASGATIPVLQHIFYIRETDTGRRLALATICRDITERKHTELALNKAQQELAHASRVLSINELAASLAHEITQPLAAIVANANAARRWLERRMPDYRRACASLDSIVRDGDRAGAIIQRVRAFSANVRSSPARVNINDVIREVVEIARQQAARERVALHVRFADDLPAVVADRIELQQVLLNLVINGIEALRPVVDRPRELRVRSARRKGSLEVSVRDNANGMAAADLERIFEAFFTTRSRGLGLGLAISRRIIESYGGTLRATPNSGCGLTLRFTLPVRRHA